MDDNIKAMIYHVGGRLWDFAFDRMTSGRRNPVATRIDQINKVIQSLPAEPQELTESPPAAAQSQDEAASPPAEASATSNPRAAPSQAAYSGISQISAQGVGCVPCGSSHFQTVAGGLSEAMRFARSEGIGHPEVIARINACETELNTFERWDASPEKVALLQGEEKALMNDMLNASRELRHRLSDIKSVEQLEQTAARAQMLAIDFRSRLFLMQVGKMTPEMREDIRRRAEAIRAKLGKEGEPMTLEEAKRLAAEQAAKEVEARWRSQEKK